jgi:23S rRNA pseudouridine955/2504/2580 synthase
MDQAPPDKSSEKIRVIAADDGGVRLDRWLRRHFPDTTQGQLQKLLRTGQIRLDGKRVDANARLEAGQTLRLPPQLLFATPKPAGFGAQAMRHADNLKQLVIFEDADVIVLNKPAGLAVQGGTGLKENLDDSLMALSRDGQTRPKLVHRLDRDTSGVLLIARTDFAATRLAAAFRSRDTRKIYWAVTVGVPKPQHGEIDAPLIKVGETMRVAEAKNDEAKRALTRYEVLEHARKEAALVALQPVTGRTHQLRVHLAHLATPILGDRLYGGAAPESWPAAELGSGLHLHARRLIIPHPRKGMLDIAAPLPPPLQQTFRWFGFDASAADAAFSD